MKGLTGALLAEGEGELDCGGTGPRLGENLTLNVHLGGGSRCAQEATGAMSIFRLNQNHVVLLSGKLK